MLLKMAECVSWKSDDKVENCVFALPGRCNSGAELVRDYASCAKLNNTLYVGITPSGYAWYPMPNNPKDQDNAVAGLRVARETIERYIVAVQEKYNIPRNKIVLVGFSAGGVMAVEVAAHSDEAFAAVACHSGAILEPIKLPKAKHPSMPILLTHNQDDYCFDWFERYLPMRNALVRKGYNALSIEAKIGGHVLTIDDVESVGAYLAHECFGQGEHWPLNKITKFDVCLK